MKYYETMFILKPTLVEEEIKAKIDFYKEAITKNGGSIETCLDMGMRNLAYEINKNKRGYYFVIYFQAQAKFILELERLYRINEDILRFIVIKYESKKDQKSWKTLVDRANKKPEAKAAFKQPPREKPKTDFETKESVAIEVQPPTQDQAE
ncbi:30S ribosomal protein S6 [Helicobacter sp. 11S03491-1]|uniref:30S ribosomal protein S6 n=1 Tax=Helicobacter sp. 11S03491-1 TaxID=1476196 RepID=UPI000BA61DFF|nr:30S ribosomal protein S6 [Helicobacter sp. 11S03491-1]PAF42037.1 30S ribosomal protein S6 [Helicobacter sp. 11S03491-1]